MSVTQLKGIIYLTSAPLRRKSCGLEWRYQRQFQA